MVSVTSPLASAVGTPAGTLTAPTVLPIDALPDRGLRELLRELPHTARRIWPAWAMLVSSVVLGLGIVAGLVLLAVREGFTPEIVTFLVWGPLFGANSVAGLLILHRYPAHRVGWALCGAGVIWIAANASFAYGSVAFAFPSLGLPAAVPVLQAGFFYPFGLYLLVVELPLIFPTGRLASPRWRPVRWLGLAGATGASLMVGFGSPVAMNGDFGDIPNPWQVPGPLGAAMETAGFGFLLLFAMGVPAGVSMVRRLRRATGDERMQLRWIAWAGVILVAGYVVHLVTISAFTDAGWYWVVFALWGLALNGFGIVVGIAILRYRLYDIDLVIHRSVVSTALVVSITALYLALTALLDAAARRLDTDRPEPWLTSLVVACGVALVVLPLRQWLEARVSAWLYGTRARPDETLGRLGARLEAAGSPAEVLGEVARTVTDLLRFPHAAIALRTDRGLEVIAEAGTPGLTQVGTPMVHHHEWIGELRVSPRGPGEGFSRADIAALEAIARQAAVAAYAFRVTDDLRHARERLVTAREEERRRLRRDLHDGLGAQLAALTMQANGVRRLVRTDAGAAEREIDHLQAELRVAIVDIRRLVHGLRPPALDEHGLVTALRTRMLAFDQSGGARITLEVTGDDAALPAAVEVAIYRIVEEALTNATRHAAADRVRVSLHIGKVVALRVADDGRGFPDPVRPGVGVQSMRERTEELGGTFAIGPGERGGTADGTEVVVTLPLPQGGAA